MYASEEPTLWKKAAEISTWVLLFVVFIPGTALGYFAENSLPNTSLYPIKRDIETVVLALSSFNKATKTLYQLELAKIRIQETNQLFASNNKVTAEDINQIAIAAQQIQVAQASIDTISDPVQKAQMQQQLSQQAQNYKKQLSHLQQQINSNPTSNTSATTTTHQTPLAPTTTQIENTTNTTNQDNGTNTSVTTDTTTTSSTTDTTTSPDLSNLTPDQQTNLEQTIQDTTDQLNTFIEASPSPTPTIPTPTAFQFHHSDGHDGDHQNTNQFTTDGNHNDNQGDH